MPTFPKGHWTWQTHARNAELRKSLNQQQPAPGITTSPGTVRYTYDPADALTLRGIPAVSKGVPGRIAGTRPDAIADRE